MLAAPPFGQAAKYFAISNCIRFHPETEILAAANLESDSVSNEAIYLFTTWAIPLVIAITFHEAAHGFVAHRLGDDTAWQLGRVTLNPLKHIDPFGTICLSGVDWKTPV